MLELVEDAISQALDRTVTAVAPAASSADDLLGPLSSLSGGGKRLRARLVLAAHDSFNAPRPEQAVAVAAAVELFQTAALVHDDVLDSADTRRGAPTVHRALAVRHASENWSGSSEHFGTSGAILAGDIALMASHRAIARASAELGPTHGVRVADLFADMAQLCTAGQYMDMRTAAQPLDALQSQEDEIVTIMRSKTSSYTTEFPMALGAAVAGADDGAISALRRVGVPLGLAFQLRDDVLGLVGLPEITGKPAGDDVREGKRTLLVTHAWAHGDDSIRHRIRAAFASPTASEEAITSAVEAIVSTGAVDAVEARITSEVERAHRELAGAHASGLIPANAVDALAAVVGQLSQRVA